MSITKIETNLKVGADVEIGHHTVIVGVNGSGKSTCINAIELALTGRASDIAGRVDVAREADVLSMAPAGEALTAKITFADGRTASYRAEGTTAKAKKASRSVPDDLAHDDVLPIRSLREAVLGSPTTARKFLLGKISGAATLADVEATLPAQVQALWRKVTAAAAPGAAVADVLIGALEDATSRQRKAGEEAKAARSAAKLVSGEFASPPGEAEIQKAREAAALTQVLWSRAAAEASRLAQSADAEEKLSGAKIRLDTARRELAKATDALVSAPATANLTLLEDAVRLHKASTEADLCLVCGADGKPAEAHLEDLTRSLAAGREAIKAHRAAEDAVARWEAEFDRAQAAVDALEAVLAVGDAYEGPDVDAAKVVMDRAQSILSSLEAARDNWAVVQRSESVALEAERQAGQWKVLKEALEAAVGTVLDRALAAFVAKVQANLPEGDVFDLRLKDGDREVVQFGLVRSGHLHTALSGAEWARVMAAMAEACVPEGRYACVIPEERAFDPKTLSEVLKALGSCRHQVIVASPVAPKPVPKGWTVVKRGEEA